MIVYHTTPLRNLSSIIADGLLVAKSKGKTKAVWVHTRGRSEWAFLHVCSRKRVSIRRICRLQLSVPRNWCRRSRNGLWKVLRDVPGNRIISVAGFDVLSASPITSEE